MSPGDRTGSYLPIGAYALIGDCHTAALVSRDGSVDWYCPERFDAPAVFCRLLDAGGGGSFGLAPRGPFAATRRYLGPTNVLETTFRADGGSVRLTDLLSIHARGPYRAGYDVGTANRLLRCVEGMDGDVELEVRFDPTFDYARAPAEVDVCPGTGAVAWAGDTYLALAAPGVAWDVGTARGLRGRLRVRAGERHWLALTSARTEEQARAALAFTDGAGELEQTLRYWEHWADACTYQGPYRAEVLRSALALKLLDHEPTGAIIAAPTTSLPETIGGERNWDYRYAWLRDSALMLYALTAVGYPEEAQDFFTWLGRVADPNVGASPQIMYGVGGERDLHEVVLDHLEGYRGSRPVRIGNGAFDQRQLDVYGEVLRAAYIFYQHGVEDRRDGEPAGPAASRCPPDATWALLRGLVEQADAHWAETDQGLWEVRGAPRHFLNSKLLCWAALDRGIRLAEAHGLAAPLTRWRETRRAIRTAILTQGYDVGRGAFTQAFGKPALDAAALRLPLVGFLPATDPRVRSTVERIQAELTHNGLVYRYHVVDTDDGLQGDEATFALCSFWLVDALALGGRLDEAHALFERLLGYANDVGLLAEEIEAGTGELLGNFPQGFTHLGLINAAVNLAKAGRHGAERTAENEAERLAQVSDPRARNYGA